MLVFFVCRIQRALCLCLARAAAILLLFLPSCPFLLLVSRLTFIALFWCVISYGFLLALHLSLCALVNILWPCFAICHRISWDAVGFWLCKSLFVQQPNKINAVNFVEIGEYGVREREIAMPSSVDGVQWVCITICIHRYFNNNQVTKCRLANAKIDSRICIIATPLPRIFKRFYRCEHTQNAIYIFSFAVFVY